MAIPELIRLLGKRGVRFAKALEIARRVFAYTNHTVMQEALEKWDVELLRSVAPEIARIIVRIDEAFAGSLPGAIVDVSGLAIVENGQAHMARLSVYATHAVNGVAEIHSELLKRTVFHHFYELYPDRFTNVTNGVTQRRWLLLCDPELSRLIAGRIGTGSRPTSPALKALAPHIEDMADEFMAVKRLKKEQLSRSCAGTTAWSSIRTSCSTCRSSACTSTSGN